MYIRLYRGYGVGQHILYRMTLFGAVILNMLWGDILEPETASSICAPAQAIAHLWRGKLSTAARAGRTASAEALQAVERWKETLRANYGAGLNGIQGQYSGIVPRGKGLSS